MKVEEIITLNSYFDIYEALLTERQKEVFQYYYHDDLSYQEIADILNISRSGVYDILKRTKDLLIELENKLNFVLKYDKLLSDLRALKNPEVDSILSKHTRGGNYE